MRFKDVEISFAHEVSSIREEISSFLPDIERNFGKVREKAERLYSTASLSPGEAVMKAWREVEVSTLNLILRQQPHLKLDSKTPYKQLERLLPEQGLVESSHLKIYYELRGLRNKVAHVEQYEVTSEQAREYINLALALSEYLASKAEALAK